MYFVYEKFYLNTRYKVRDTKYDTPMNAISGIKIGGAAIVLTIVLLYAYARSEPFVRGPRITITSPLSGETLHTQSVIIHGNIERASHIALNGRQVYTNESGALTEEMLLAEGYNIFEISAEDRFGRIEEKKLEIVYK